jgi:hypothetical protein
MAHRWLLTDEIRDKVRPQIEEYIKILHTIDLDDVKIDIPELDFSDTSINPYQLCKMLKELGWEQGTQEDNGWQMDFWIPFTKENEYPLLLSGCGITFELKLAIDIDKYQ